MIPHCRTPPKMLLTSFCNFQFEIGLVFPLTLNGNTRPISNWKDPSDLHSTPILVPSRVLWPGIPHSIAQRINIAFTLDPLSMCKQRCCKVALRSAICVQSEPDSVNDSQKTR